MHIFTFTLETKWVEQLESIKKRKKTKQIRMCLNKCLAHRKAAELQYNTIHKPIWWENSVHIKSEDFQNETTVVVDLLYQNIF